MIVVKINKEAHSMVRPIIYDDKFVKMVDIIDLLIPMMHDIVTNLCKARGGNKIAAQRVRVKMITLEKLSKEFRKISVIRKVKNDE
jgi:hypothetical protein